MVRYLSIFFCSFLISVTASGVGAKDLERVLVAPQGEVKAGQSLSFTVYYNNLTEYPIQTSSISKPISCRVSAGDKQIEIVAEPENQPSDSSLTIPGNGFKKVQYQFSLPPDFNGNVTISLTGTTANAAAS